MSVAEPFSQLTGTLAVYIANYGVAIPLVNATPGAGYTLMGNTDGDQSIQHVGSNTYFRDNAHQGPVVAVTPEEDTIVRFTLVDLTLELYAAILHAATNVVTDAGPPVTKTIRLKKGANPKQYVMLFRGTAMSPYGSFPGMYVTPKGVFDGDPQPTWGKDGRPALEIEFHTLEDLNQADQQKSMGWLVVQSA